jgi:LysR family positive regulator for ilvC
MDFEKLRMFAQLAETKNFNRAAQQLHISASKLSRVIKSIEHQLDCALFERDNRHVALTAQGDTLLEFAREQIQQWDTLQDRIKPEKDTLSGTISLYCSVTASYSFLFELLDRFRTLHPHIQIKLHTGDTADAIERVNSGQEDLAIAALPQKLPKGLSFKRFDSSPLTLICSADDTRFERLYRNRQDQAWADIPLIVSERGLSRQHFDHWLEQHDIEPNIYSEVAGHEAIVSMVSLGCGVGLVPKIVLENSPLKSRVKPFVFQPQLDDYDVGLTVQTRRLKSPLVRALWSIID